MKYLPTDPSCAAGRLIPKRRAPKCCICGRVLWKAIHVNYGVPIHNRKGERLGYVPDHRTVDVSSTAGLKDSQRCWNGKACEKRANA